MTTLMRTTLMMPICALQVLASKEECHSIPALAPHVLLVGTSLQLASAAMTTIPLANAPLEVPSTAS